MATNILAALKQSNKLFKAATIRLKELDSDFKIPEGIFTGKIVNFKLDQINDKLCIKRSFLISKSATGEFDGFTTKDMMFLNSDFGIAFALKMFIQFEIFEARDSKSMEDFVLFVKKANAIKDFYVFDAVYNKAGYLNINIVKKVESEIEVNSEVESESEVDSEVNSEVNSEVEFEDEIVDDFTEEFISETTFKENEIVDDFANNEKSTTENNKPFYDDSNVPDIPELNNESGSLEKYKKKLKAFIAANDIEIPNLNRLSTDELIDQIKNNVVEGITNLEKTEKTLLKNVGLVHLIR